jgi:hypothetical protein
MMVTAHTIAGCNKQEPLNEASSTVTSFDDAPMDAEDIELMSWIAACVVERHKDVRHHSHEYIGMVCRMPRSGRRAVLEAIETHEQVHVVGGGFDRTAQETAMSIERLERTVLDAGGDQALADALVLDHYNWARRYLG